MHNDLERFIQSTEIGEFDKDERLIRILYPHFKKGYSLLELCCYHGAVDCFKLLRTKFNSKITEKCLRFSFLGGNQEIMSECLKYQEPNKYCMKYAIISHNIDFVTFLMNEHNIEINLSLCWEYNNLESLLVYFDQTNDINNCFYYSALLYIPSLCEYFLSLGADINDKVDGRTALHIAAQKNYKETAEFLISHGANIDEKDKYGVDALYHASEYNSKETAEVLLSHGANINKKYNEGQTALHMASHWNCIETAELFLSHGANINEKDNNGETALHYTAYHDSKGTAELLISHGININEKDNFGKTALHTAAKENCKETAELLISHGANIDEKDEDGETALHIASEHISKETVEVLLSHGAKI